MSSEDWQGATLSAAAVLLLPLLPLLRLLPLPRLLVLLAVTGNVTIFTLVIMFDLNTCSSSVTLTQAWNFMYIGGSALLTKSYSPSEGPKLQAVTAAGRWKGGVWSMGCVESVMACYGSITAAVLSS